MKKIFCNLFNKPSFVLYHALGTFFIFTLLRIIPVYHILADFYRISHVSYTRKISVFCEYVFLSFFDALWYEQAALILLSFLVSLNFMLFVIFAKRQKKMLSKRSFIASLSGMIFGLFGVGCLSCGALIAAPLLTVLGFGAYLGFFTSNAFFIMCIGIFCIVMSIMYLLYQLSRPAVCSV